MRGGREISKRRGRLVHDESKIRIKSKSKEAGNARWGRDPIKCSGTKLFVRASQEHGSTEVPRDRYRVRAASAIHFPIELQNESAHSLSQPLSCPLLGTNHWPCGDRLDRPNDHLHTTRYESFPAREPG